MPDISRHFSERRIQTYQGQIYVQDHAGDGDAFVLMHGFPDNRRIYDDLVPHLVAAGRRVVAFDFLGFGESERKDGARYSFAQQLDDLAAVVRGLQLERIIPVGHDASGPAAINFTMDHPDRVSSLCLINSLYAAGPNIRVPELVLLFAIDGLKALSSAIVHDAEQFAWLLRFQQKIFRDALPEGQRATFRSSLAPIISDNFIGEHSAAIAFMQVAEQLFPEVTKNASRLAAVATMKTPVTLIWGEHNPYLSSGVAGNLMPYLQDAKLNVLPAGHWPQVDMPAEVARLMLGL